MDWELIILSFMAFVFVMSILFTIMFFRLLIIDGVGFDMFTLCYIVMIGIGVFSTIILGGILYETIWGTGI